MMSANTTPERLLHRIDLKVVRRLDGLRQGDFRTLFYGSGIDFADLRDYQPDDDVRRIDWNVTARMDTPFVRQYVEERDLTAWLLVDRSASMTLQTSTRSKALAVTEFVTTLARLLTRAGNRVGAVLFNDEIEQTLPPAGGRNQVLRIASELLRPVMPSAAGTELGRLLDSARQSLRRRSLVFVLSDFISSPGWDRSLGALAQRHEVVAIRFVDPAERELPSLGLMVLEDAESGQQLTVDTSDPGFRERYQAAVAARQRELRAATARAGVDLHEINTDEDLLGSLVRLSEQRRRRVAS